MVDVANPTRREMKSIQACGFQSAAEHTRATLQSHGAQCEVVKAFNTLAAYPLLGCYTQSAVSSTVIAGDNEQACKTVQQFCTACGINGYLRQSLTAARILEGEQLAIAERWVKPFIIMFAIFAFYYIWTLIRKETYVDPNPDPDHPPTPYWKGMLWNYCYIAMGWQALTGFALTYTPGPMVYIFKCLTGQHSVRLWGWVKGWLDMRKELGCLAALSIFAHIICGLMDFINHSPYLVMLDSHDGFGWNYNWSIMSGALSATFVIPVAITSLPTVASDLSWYSWYFWQQLGWVTLLFAVLHVQFFWGEYSSNMWNLSWREYGNKVPYFVSLLFPLAYIPLFFKLIASIPGLWRFPIFKCFFRNGHDDIPCYVMAPNKSKGKKAVAPSDLPK